MDPLSSILGLLRPSAYLTAGFDAGGGWSLLLDDLAGRVKCYTVVVGTCWLALEGGGTQIELAAGDCFVLPSGRPVRIGSDLTQEPLLASEVLAPDGHGKTVTWNGGGDVLLAGCRFDLNGRHSEAMLRILPPLMHLRAGPDQNALRWSIELMMQELRDGRPGAALIAQHLAHMMLVQTLRLYLSSETVTGTGWFAGLTDPRLGAALEALHADPARRWTLDMLAQCAGLSRTIFAERFRDRVGETPIAYLTRWRMTLAAERLITTRDPLIMIAAEVGYESESAFTAAFGRLMGTSPRRYAASADHRAEIP